MIELADPETVKAVVEAGRVCVARGGAQVRRFLPAAGYSADVAVKRIAPDEPRRLIFGQRYRVAIRVDGVHARAHALSMEIDAWLDAQQWALQAFWDQGVMGDDLRLGYDAQKGSNMIRDGRHRMSLWYVFRDRTQAVHP